MANEDTIRLLRETNAGIKMGVEAIEEVLSKVKDDNLRTLLTDSLDEHKRLGDKTHAILLSDGEEDKEPNIMAKSMSWLKTNMKLAADGSDSAIADLITDGCNMGVKSLGRYLNQYKHADDNVKDIARKLIRLEADLAENIRRFL